MNKKIILEKGMHVLFFIAALTSILAVLLICVFMFTNGFPAIFEIGFLEFFTQTDWFPSNEPASFGILSMIIGTLYVTAGAILVGVPIGLLTAIFMAKFCPKTIYPILKQGINLLAGIPSIIYGFFGLVVIVPFIRAEIGGAGKSILTASILLGIMILPTIINLSEAALRAVPKEYYEGAIALGATHERASFTVVPKGAKSGIMASIILGIGRAVGETMAVVMIAGNQARITGNVLSGIRTLTANIALEMGYAAGLHREALIATGLVLFVFILILNICFSLINNRKKD